MNSDAPDNPKDGSSWTLLLILLSVVGFLLYFRSNRASAPSVPYSFFLKEMLEKGEVSSVYVVWIILIFSGALCTKFNFLPKILMLCIP